MNLIHDNRLLDEEREKARKQMSRYVGISAEEYSRGGSSTSAHSANITGFGNPNFSSRGQRDSRQSSESSYARGYDSDPKHEARETKEPAPPLKLSFFEESKSAVSEPSKPGAVEPQKPAKPLTPPSFFEQPKVAQPPVRSVQEERKPGAAPVDIFAPPVMAKQPAVQVAPATQLFPNTAHMPSTHTVTPAAPIFAPPPPAFIIPQQQVFTATSFVPSHPISSTVPVNPVPVFPAPNQTVLQPTFTAQFPAFPSQPAPPQYTTPVQPPTYPTSYNPTYPAQPKPAIQAKPVVQPDPRFHFHHNMDAYSGPTLSELKVTPGLKEEFTEFHTAPGAQTKPADPESMLVNLDNLLVESKKKTDPRYNIGF